MKEIILIKNGELALKGLNRSAFESVLVKNLRRNLRDVGAVNIRKAQSTIIVEPQGDDFSIERALPRVASVFGIAAFSRAAVVEKDMQAILEVAPTYLASALKKVKTFKVNAKRADKQFPYGSPEICATVGGKLLEAFPHLRVDVHEPELTVMVEIRDFGAYVHAGQLKGAGGMPVGTAGKATILISGGIDSPVAAWMMAKRGISLNAVHFASPPYTSERALLKVKQLLKKVSVYSGSIPLAVVPFTEIQEQIAQNCKEEYFTLIMRQFMMEIAEAIALQKGSLGLITGESLGQVASQTLPALAVTDASTKELPVLRPLIGMDKDEIIEISRKIDTFEIAIQPYEDCCTVFTPKHPKTRPTKQAVDEARACLDIEGLNARAVEGTEYEYID